jgi:hypothetical protein
MTTHSEWSGRIASACAATEVARQRLMATARRLLEESTTRRTNGHAHPAPVVHLPAPGRQPAEDAAEEQIEACLSGFHPKG